MILRKPYAFFIKYFRLINLIMAVFMGIMVYRTIIVSRFLAEYVNDYTIASTSFSVSKYMNFYSFLMVFFIIVLTLVITSVMFVKNKPKKLYIINLAIYVAVMILYMVDYSTINTISTKLLDFRVSGALRDINYMLLIAQVVSLLLTLVRATGFDIKSFEFAQDLQDLDINTKDNEEFEVSLEFDKNKAKRNFRRNVRNLKYSYIEHKFFINMTVVIILLIGVFAFFMNKNIYSSYYNQGQSFNASSLSLTINDSYITNKDQKGKVIDSKNYLVVVNFDVKGLFKSTKSFNTGLATLEIGNKSYGQTNAYNSYLSDLGTGYVDQKLTNDYETYLLVFKIPKSEKNKSMILKINDNVSYIRGELGAKNIYIKLKPQDLTQKTSTVETNYKDTVVFSGSVLKDTSLKINSASISNMFKVEYDFCSKKDNCYKSYEYVTPTATGNYFKTLLKLECEYDLDENLNITTLNNVYYLLNTFGTFYYQIDGKWYSEKISSEIVKPKVGKETDITYIEVPKEAEKASSMYLSLNVRNYTYKYMLK